MSDIKAESTPDERGEGGERMRGDSQFSDSKRVNQDDGWYGGMYYDDMGDVMELGAVYDDALKKRSEFCNYAVLVANNIMEDLGIKGRATWGKWGARLEPKLNPELDIDETAKRIIEHPAWKALKLSTKVFTCGHSDEAIQEFQSQCERCGDYGHFDFRCPQRENWG